VTGFNPLTAFTWSRNSRAVADISPSSNPTCRFAKDGCTVGEFLDQVKAVSGLKPVTFEIYAKKFRSLVAGVSKIDGGKANNTNCNGEVTRRGSTNLRRPPRQAHARPINEWKSAN